METLAKQYNDFQARMGRGSEDNHCQAQIETLFHPQFTKIINGDTLISSRDDLYSQLMDARSHVGLWTIHEKEILPVQGGKACVIRYIVSTTQKGDFDIMAILTSADGVHIDKVDEVAHLIAKQEPNLREQAS